MTLPRSKIIRGVPVETVTVCKLSEPSDLPDTDFIKFNPESSPKRPHQEEMEEVLRCRFEEGIHQGFQEGKSEGFSEGEAKGFEEGVKQGRQDVEAELKNLLVLLDRSAQELLDRQKSLADEAKPQLVKFALVVCERVFRNRLNNSEELKAQLQDIFHQARPIMKEVVVDIFLNSEDYETLRHCLSDVQPDCHEARRLNYLVDENLKKGDIRVETPLGLVNFDIERILADLARKSLGVHGEEENDKAFLASKGIKG